MSNLIDNLIRNGWLKTPRIIEAFQKIKRVDFMPENIRHLAELDEPLPIGYGQTISQPLVVAFMIEHLQPQAGNKILDIGSGSGWTSALLAHIVSNGELKSKIKSQKSKTKGKIIAVEIVSELAEFCKKNVAKYNFIEKGIVEVVCADGSKGYKQKAPYDRILVSAAVQKKEIPEQWKKQLKIGGRIVTPVFSSIWLLIKKSEKEFEKIEFPGFAFVPLIEKKRHKPILGC